MSLLLQKHDHSEALSEAFDELKEPVNMLRIFTRGGDLCLVNCDLFCMLSPLVRSIVRNIPCCTSYMIFIPELSKKSVDTIIGLVKNGYEEFIGDSSSYVTSVREAAEVLQIRLGNLSVSERYEHNINLISTAKIETEESKSLTQTFELKYKG